MNALLKELAPKGSMLYYSLLFCNLETRALILAAEGFYRAIYHISQAYIHQDIAEKKLNYWHDEILRLFQKQAQHPFVQVLEKRLEVVRLSPQLFLTQIEEFHQVIHQPRLSTWTDFQFHAHHSRSLCEIVKTYLLLDQQTQSALTFARNLGVFLRAAEVLIHIRLDINQDIILIPQEFLNQFSVTDELLRQRKTNFAIKRLFEFFYHEILKLYNEAEENWRQLNTNEKKSIHPQWLYAQLILKLLAEIKKDRFHVLEKQYFLPAIRQYFFVVKEAFKIISYYS